MDFFQSEKTSALFRRAVAKLTVSLNLFFFSLPVFKVLTCFFVFFSAGMVNLSSVQLLCVFLQAFSRLISFTPNLPDSADINSSSFVIVEAFQ